MSDVFNFSIISVKVMMKELEEYIKEHICKDFECLYDTLSNLALGNQHYSLISMLVPHFYNYINECEMIIKKYGWQIDLESKVKQKYNKGLKSVFKKLRGRSIKLYINSNIKTFDGIKSFIEDATVAFNNYHNSNTASNYSITYFKDNPISNYHLLSNKFYKFQIGVFSSSLNFDLQRIIETISYILIVFIVSNKNQPLNLKFTQDKIVEKFVLQDKNYLLNMGPTTIKMIPVIDILCVANFTKELLPKLIKRDILLTKITYVNVYFCIKSLNKILEISGRQENVEDLIYNLSLVDDEKESIIKNCRHYGFDFKDENIEEKKDPFIADIENRANMSYQCFKEKIRKLNSKLIDTILKIYEFQWRQKG